MIWIWKTFKWLAIGLVSLIALTLAAGYIYQQLRESGDLARYPAPGRLVAVDGRLMHINCIGRGSPTAVFELGIGSASATWRSVHEQVARFTTACAYDRPGLGYSEPTDESLRSGNVAERLHELLSAAGIEDDLVLVGWSAGGIYVREYHRRYPERVAALLFVDSSHEQQAGRMPETGGNGADPMLKIARHLAPFGIVRMSGVLDRRVDRGPGPEEFKSRLKAIYNQSHTLDTLWRESEAFNLDIDASRPPSPVGDLPLVVLSRGIPGEPDQADDVHHDLQQELVQLSTNARHIIASESGHHIYADQPALVVESIEALVLSVREQRLPD